MFGLGLILSVVENIEVTSAPAEISSVKSESQSFDQAMLGILAVFAVIWGLICLLSFTLTEMFTSEHFMKAYSAEQLTYLKNTSPWVVAAKAISAIATLTGAVYLLLRKKSTYYWFSAALAATLVVMIDSVLRDGYNLLAGMETGVNLGMVIVSIFLFWAANIAFYSGQLND